MPSPSHTGALQLGFDLRFEDLYDTQGLRELDAAFLTTLGETGPELRDRLLLARNKSAALSAKEEADLLINLGPALETFIARLFGIEAEASALRTRHTELAPLYSCKRHFVQRRVLKASDPQLAASVNGEQLARQLSERFGAPFSELAFARHVEAWQREEAAYAEDIDLAVRYAAWALHTEAGRAKHRHGVLFKAPSKLQPERLVPLHSDSIQGFTAHQAHAEHARRREGFRLTDAGTDLTGALDETNYCIWCHHQGKDSCSKGLREKTTAASVFKKSPFGIPLAGCPLEERISEFQELKTNGYSIAALAIICVDNPMTAATGHRICNDCMKSCIYQKQEPVNIPQAETRVLKDVLALPYGFEIYSLLTRWNPLDLRRPYPREASGRRVLVVGMGPAGFTLAHHLLNDGHSVAAIDGLKIEPLPAHLSGVNADGTRAAFHPIRDVREVYEALDERIMAGFGGVAEYGITVRWDKNFLKLIRLLLERRSAFALYGGVRFGGTVRLEDAWALGFDHVALCAGAGKPTILDIPNGLARGVRAASDFLMALQLTGAAKADSIANLQIRMPIVVIGGGLTAIDTATESMAYYTVQVEKFLHRYETLAAKHGEAEVRDKWDTEEAAIADEFLTHARAIRAERAQAQQENRAPRILELLRVWGGATIAYRKRLIDSPSYTLNHEEVAKALEEGVVFAEGLTPLRIDLDAHQHARSISFSAQQRTADGTWQDAGPVTLPARSILVAAGTQPNTVLAREDAAHFHLDGRYFQTLDENGAPVKPEYSSAKPAIPHVLLSRGADGRCVSFFGDLHPSYFGNVVKAMGGAKQGYPIVSRVLAQLPYSSACDDATFFGGLNSLLRASVVRVERLTPTIVEVVVKAPLAARRFEPGQFYRLQNFETLAPRVNDTRLAMEGLALTGAWVDRAAGLISTIVLEMGGSSNLCTLLKPGEPIVLMGPTGAPTEIPRNETVLLAGGGLGNAVLFSIGAALRQAGCKVLYFAGYRRAADRYKVEDIETASDTIVWCCDEAPGFAPARPQDKTFVGNIVQAMRAYADGALGTPPIRMQDVDRIIAIGSDAMMNAVAKARHGVLRDCLKPGHIGIGSINSPMQCMMKEVCAQCLQPHIDPATGKRSVIFSCFNQDQPLDQVDFAALASRLRQNSTQEKLTAQWIAQCVASLP